MDEHQQNNSCRIKLMGVRLCPKFDSSYLVDGFNPDA